AEEESIQPGRPFWLGVELDIANGWHTYWKNPGDLGLASKLEWELPEGFTVDSLQWPYPERFETNEFVNFGYQGKVLLLTRLIPPVSLLEMDELTLAVNVHWFACKDQCLPGLEKVSITLAVKSSPPIVNKQTANDFALARENLPNKLWNVSAQSIDGGITLHLTPSNMENLSLSDVYFYPYQPGLIDTHAKQELIVDTSRYTLNIKNINDSFSAEIPYVTGVLVSSNGWDGSGKEGAMEINTPLLSGNMKSYNLTHDKIQKSEAPEHSKKGSETFGGVTLNLEKLPPFSNLLFFAFLGGMILNLMPCVFPVISLKILHFLGLSGQSRFQLFLHGVFFTTGVLLSFWSLGILLFALRMGGASVGWGFQLQEPLFVASLAVFFFLCSLSLFEVFTIGLFSVSGDPHKQTRSVYIGSLLSGILATVVATPCIGPFLGPTLGIALTMPPLQALIILTFVGLGMSTPYLFFAIFPSAIRLLPKPGAWMIVFKQVMGFFMMAASIWLIWVLGAQTDNNSVFFLLLALLFMGIASWIYGSWGNLYKSRVSKAVGMILAISLFTTGVFLVVEAASAQTITPDKISNNKSEQGQYKIWAPFSSERLEVLLAQGNPVFIDFTAKWCLICQGNKVALQSTKIADEFARRGVATLVADWTVQDPVITRELEKFGRSGVPLYLLYSGDPLEAPHILPQLLTKDIIIEYLDKIR
ncbi:MAG: thiol:disulfide interchange protein/DsbC/DsbD-like thiol-disulfide interchange protein, partial [Chlamydiales bacterium]